MSDLLMRMGEATSAAEFIRLYKNAQRVPAHSVGVQIRTRLDLPLGDDGC